jgi:hypothetical protein
VGFFTFSPFLDHPVKKPTLALDTCPRARVGFFTFSPFLDHPVKKPTLPLDTCPRAGVGFFAFIPFLAGSRNMSYWQLPDYVLP